MARLGDGLSDDASGIEARLFDRAAIVGVVAAIHTASGEIDDHRRILQFFDPTAQSLRIPHRRTPRSAARLAAEDNNIVAVTVKRSRQDRADLPRTAGYYHLHLSRPSVRAAANRPLLNRQRSPAHNSAVAEALGTR